MTLPRHGARWAAWRRCSKRLSTSSASCRWWRRAEWTAHSRTTARSTMRIDIASWICRWRRRVWRPRWRRRRWQSRPAAMANLLGDLWRGGEPDWGAVCAFPTAKLHLYGKLAPRPGRKMGHIAALAGTAEEAERIVRAARDAASGGAPRWEQAALPHS